MKNIVTLNEWSEIGRQLNNEAKTIVLVGGCFDILHDGHLKYLKAARDEGNILIVSLENDENVKRLKGENRPVNNENLRAQNLINTNLVDYVIILPNLRTGEDYLEMVKLIKPDVIAITRGDTQTENKKSQAKIIGAKVKEVIDRLPGLSTSNIISKAN